MLRIAIRITSYNVCYTKLLRKTGGLMLLIAGGGILCAIVASFLSSKSAVGLGRIIRNKVFNRVESYSLNEFDKLGTSTLITRTTNDITQVQNVTVMIMRMMISAPMMAIGGIIMALGKDRSLRITSYNVCYTKLLRHYFFLT